MKLSLIAAACLLLLSGRAWAAQQDQSTGDTTAAPATPEPTAKPPAPPETPPAPPADSSVTAKPETSTPAATGQWVYTQQYGWVWMPYGNQYVYESTGESAAPYAYVYYPAWAAWTWVAAPWVWGWGPSPWFGFVGGWGFAWYHGPFHYYPWGWHGYWYGRPGYWGHGWRAAPARGFYPARPGVPYRPGGYAFRPGGTYAARPGGVTIHGGGHAGGFHGGGFHGGGHR